MQAARILLATNLLALPLMAGAEGDPVTGAGNDPAPDGVLVGYMPVEQKIKTGEHLEYYGWVGAPFCRVVTDYRTIWCCRHTLRVMDGCKGLPVCTDQ